MQRNSDRALRMARHIKSKSCISRFDPDVLDSGTQRLQDQPERQLHAQTKGKTGNRESGHVPPQTCIASLRLTRPHGRGISGQMRGMRNKVRSHAPDAVPV